MPPIFLSFAHDEQDCKFFIANTTGNRAHLKNMYVLFHPFLLVIFFSSPPPHLLRCNPLPCTPNTGNSEKKTWQLKSVPTLCIPVTTPRVMSISLFASFRNRMSKKKIDFYYSDGTECLESFTTKESKISFHRIHCPARPLKLSKIVTQYYCLCWGSIEDKIKISGGDQV